MASNKRDESRMDYYELKRKHEEWLKSFEPEHRSAEALANVAASPKKKAGVNSQSTPSEAVQPVRPAPRAHHTNDIPVNSPSEDATHTASPKSIPVDSAPEIPEIFTTEEKSRFNTMPIEKATDEFLTEDDESEPNPFDPFLKLVGKVKDRIIIRKRRVPDEAETDDEDFDSDAFDDDKTDALSMPEDSSFEALDDGDDLFEEDEDIEPEPQRPRIGFKLPAFNFKRKDSSAEDEDLDDDWDDEDFEDDESEEENTIKRSLKDTLKKRFARPPKKDYFEESDNFDTEFESAEPITNDTEFPIRENRPVNDSFQKDLEEAIVFAHPISNPTSEIHKENITVVSEGGYKMADQKEKNIAELTALLAESIDNDAEGKTTLSRRERRMLESGEAVAEQPTQVYKPIRGMAAVASVVNDDESNSNDEDNDFYDDGFEEEELIPRKSKKDKKARKAAKAVEEDFDDFDFDDFGNEDTAETKIMPAVKQTPSPRDEYDDFDDEYDDDEYADEYDDDDDDDDEISVGKKILSVVKGILILVLILALAVVALRILENRGIVRLTGVRGVIGSISDEAAEWLFPEPVIVEQPIVNDLPQLDNDGYDDFSDANANFGPVATNNPVTDNNSPNLFAPSATEQPTPIPTLAPTQAPTPIPTATPLPFDNSQLDANDINNVLP